MSDPHRIGLQAAWQAADGGVWVRSFGRPTGVGAGDRVWLVIERPAGCAAVLNGRLLPSVSGGAAAWRHDVTADLRQRNELRLHFAAGVGAGVPAGRATLPEPLGVVTLQIGSGG